MNEDFIRKRITELRMKKGVSEYQMSYDLGHNKNYVRAITSGRTMPSVKGLLNICEYFEMEPSEFFDKEFPRLVRAVEESLMELNDEDILLLHNVIRRFKKSNEE